MEPVLYVGQKKNNREKSFLHNHRKITTGLRLYKTYKVKQGSTRQLLPARYHTGWNIPIFMLP